MSLIINNLPASAPAATPASIADQIRNLPVSGISQVVSNLKDQEGDQQTRGYLEALLKKGFPLDNPRIIQLRQDLAESERELETRIADAISEFLGFHVMPAPSKPMIADLAARHGVVNDDIQEARQNRIVSLAQKAGTTGVTLDDIRKEFPSTGESTIGADLNVLANGVTKRGKQILPRLNLAGGRYTVAEASDS